jgi:hypothetical protein
MKIGGLQAKQMVVLEVSVFFLLFVWLPFADIAFKLAVPSNYLTLCVKICKAEALYACV